MVESHPAARKYLRSLGYQTVSLEIQLALAIVVSA
jgi:hypothetical protein